MKWIIGLIVVTFGAFFALLFVDIQLSDDVVSGIVYDAKFNNWPGGVTYFKVRASADMAVTDDTSDTYCLPAGSEYEETIRKAAADKTIKVVTEIKSGVRIHGFLSCPDNTKVTEKEDK